MSNLNIIRYTIREWGVANLITENDLEILYKKFVINYGLPFDSIGQRHMSFRNLDSGETFCDGSGVQYTLMISGPRNIWDDFEISQI